MKAVTASKDGRGGENSPTINALREIISDKDSISCGDMSEIQPHEITEVPNSVGHVCYSFNYDTFNGIDKIYIVILRLNHTSHLYLKLVINNRDNSITRYRMAYVVYETRVTVHHDLERLGYNDICEFLESKGIDA